MSDVKIKLRGMHTTFIDEAFSRGHFFMCAITVNGNELKKLEKAFDGIMQKLEAIYPLHFDRSMELHAGEIYNGKGVWRKAFEGNRQRYEILRQFVDVLAELDTRILILGIDLVRQSQKYSLPTDPRYLSLKFLIEKIDKELDRTNDLSLLMCDSGISNQDIERIRDLLVEMQISGSGGNYPRKISRIVDTVHFSDSKRSRGIQAADLVAFIRHRIELQNVGHARRDREVEHLWEALSTSVVHERVWVP